MIAAALRLMVQGSAAGLERTYQRALVWNHTFLLHLRVQRKGRFSCFRLGVHRDHGIPCHDVAIRHSLKDLPGIHQAATFRVRIKQHCGYTCVCLELLLHDVCVDFSHMI